MALHQPAFNLGCSAGGAHPCRVDARAAIFLTTLDAACNVRRTVGSAADGAGGVTARANQALTDMALLQVAHADPMTASRHAQAVLGANVAVADDATSYALATFAATTGVARRNFVRQCVAARALLQTFMAVGATVEGIELIVAGANHPATACAGR